MATGALLTFCQSWFAQGLTLGQLLHSTSLAPGESTRIAMIDWSRRTRAAVTESIDEREQLANTMTHSRALSEVTSATAQEFQSGQSTTSATSTTKQSGGGFGLDLGILGGGGSASKSTTETDVMTAASSFGERDLAASYAQDINDRSQQNASSVRNRRASIVSEVSQEEHEQISTRVVTNYNHMHALSVQYYEVVQAFRVTTQLDRAEKCLFVPLQLVDFADPAVVDRWRLVLAEAALTQRTRRQLTVEYGVVEVIPQTPPVTPGRIVATEIREVVRTRRGDVTPPAPAGGGAAPGAEAPATPEATPTPPAAPASADAPPESAVVMDYRRAPATKTAAVLAVKGWNLEQISAIGWATGRILVQDGSDSVFVSDDALLLGFTLREGQAARFAVRRRDGAEVAVEHQSASAVAFRDPVPIAEIEAIAIQTTGDRDLRTALVLQLNVAGTVLPLDVPIALRPTSALQDAVRFGGVAAAQELRDHLAANRLHYSQAIYRTLDAAAIAALLAPFTYRGLPLGQVVDSQPVAVTANYLVFRLSVSATGQAADARWAAEETAWRQWLEARGLAQPVPRSEIVPLPSGGVFAEAVLGRYNAAEKVDLTRFWNWQDSPIPLVAPEIAPVQAGTRAQPEDLRPGQLSAPVVSIQPPAALPDPTGIAAIVAALQNGNMFRDMSGLAQTAALAQAALQASAQGATAAGAQAGQNMKTVVDAQTERLRIAAQLATAMLAPPAGGEGAKPAGRGTVTERGGELNTAEAIDAARGSQGAMSPMAPGGRGAGGAAPDRMPTLEETFRQQMTGGRGEGSAYATRFADMVASGLGLDPAMGGMQTAQAWRFRKGPQGGQGSGQPPAPAPPQPALRDLRIWVPVEAIVGDAASGEPLSGHKFWFVIMDDTHKVLFDVPWVMLDGSVITGVIRDLPAQLPWLYMSATVKLIKPQADGSPEVTEEIGPESTMITQESSAFWGQGMGGLVCLVKVPIFRQKLQFEASKTLLDALAEAGYRDPFVKNVSDETALPDGRKEVEVTAYTGDLQLSRWFRT
jgi:hypothetical protein